MVELGWTEQVAGDGHDLRKGVLGSESKMELLLSSVNSYSILYRRRMVGPCWGSRFDTR